MEKNDKPLKEPSNKHRVDFTSAQSIFVDLVKFSRKDKEILADLQIILGGYLTPPVALASDEAEATDGEDETGKTEVQTDPQEPTPAAHKNRKTGTGGRKR